MYHLLSLLTGLVIAVMISLNGSLTLKYGNYNAAVIIHIVGVLFAFFVCLISGGWNRTCRKSLFL